MSTYAENARQREIAAGRAATDQIMAARHAEFDLSAQDTHMKYERPSFIVVTASEAFRAGYDLVDWGKESHDHVEVTEGDLVRLS